MLDELVPAMEARGHETEAVQAGALRDETVRQITREGAALPERGRRLLPGIVRQLGEAPGHTEGGR